MCLGPGKAADVSTAPGTISGFFFYLRCSFYLAVTKYLRQSQEGTGGFLGYVSDYSAAGHLSHIALDTVHFGGS